MTCDSELARAHTYLQHSQVKVSLRESSLSRDHALACMGKKCLCGLGKKIVRCKNALCIREPMEATRTTPQRINLLRGILYYTT